MEKNGILTGDYIRVNPFNRQYYTVRLNKRTIYRRRQVYIIRLMRPAIVGRYPACCTCTYTVQYNIILYNNTVDVLQRIVKMFLECCLSENPFRLTVRVHCNTRFFCASDKTF